MSYTETEIRERIARLLPSTAIINRAGATNPEEWLASLADLVTRVVCSDTDCIYYFLDLTAYELSRLCAQAAAEITSLQAEVTAARLPATSFQDDTNELADLLFEIEVAGKGRRAELAARFDTLARDFARSSKLPTGQTYLGRGRRQARAAIPGLLDTIVSLIDQVRVLATCFTTALLEYDRSDMETAANDFQATALRRSLVDRISAIDDDPQDLVFDTAISSSLLKAKLARPDIHAAKYTGTATVSKIAPVFVLGGAMPFSYPESAYPTGESATLKVNGGVAFNITCPVSPAPRFVLYPPELESSESISPSFPLLPGELYWVGDGAKVVFDLIQLRTYIKPGSVNVVAYDGATGPSNTVDVTDAGDGTFTGGVGIVVGNSLVDYVTGQLEIEFSVAIPLGHVVQVTYSYYPIGTMEWAAVPPGFAITDFNNLDFLQDGVLVSATLGQVTPIKNVADFDTALAAALAASYTTTVVDGTIEVYDENGGSAGQLVFPSISAGDYRTFESGPTWVTAPDSLGALVGLTNTATSAVQGKDTTLADIAVPNSSIKLSISPNTIVAKSTKTISSATSLVIDDASAVLAGDNLVVLSPNACVLPISVVDTATDTLTFSRKYPFSANTAVTLALVASESIDFKITRDQLKIEVVAPTTASEIEVVSAGFGLTVGTTTGFPEEITLDGDVPTDPFLIKAGDKIFQGDADIGEVTSVNAGVLGTSFSGGTLPLGTIEIRSRGRTSYLAATPEVEKGLFAISDLADWRDEVLMYAMSGTAVKQYSNAISTLQGALTDIQTGCAAMDANKVTSAEGLLRFLADEKLSGLKRVVQRCKFGDFGTLTLADISEEADLEGRMAEMAAEFSSDEEFLEVTQGDTLFGDYLDRPGSTQIDSNEPTLED